MDTAIIWTSSACQEDPGPGGYAAIIRLPDGTTQVRQDGRRLTTNNRMEIFAAIHSLSVLKAPCNIEIKSASTYLVNAINRRNASSNTDLWDRLFPLLQNHNVTATWHRARSTDEHQQTHQRALKEAQNNPRKTDTGYERRTGQWTRPTA